MSKKKVAAFTASFSFMLGLFVVLPLLAAGQKEKEGKDGLYRPLGLFTEVLSLVRSNYVEPVEMKPLFEGAFAGMTEAMDPFAEYVPPDKMAAFEAAMAAREKPGYVDSGAVLTRRYGYPVVVAAVPGSPAAAAGLKSDDLIEKVDDRQARAMSLWEVSAQLSGKAGGRVRLLVVREGKPRHRTLEVVRGSWSPEKPSVSRVSGETVVRIPSFEPGTVAALREALAPLDPTKGLVLDLRSNARGSFDEAAQAASLFVPAGPLAELKGRKIEGTSWKAEPGQRRHEGRLVVLVDSGTAGAAELFAGALREATGNSKSPFLAGETAARREPSGAGSGAVAASAPESSTSSTKTAAVTNAGNPPGGPDGEPASSPTETGPDRFEKAKKSGRPLLIGESTCGMGMKSEVVKLASGGAVKLSVGKIRTVTGRALSPRGLDPDERVFASAEPEAGEAVDAVLTRGVKLLAELTAPPSKSVS